MRAGTHPLARTHVSTPLRRGGPVSRYSARMAELVAGGGCGEKVTLRQTVLESESAREAPRSDVRFHAREVATRRWGRRTLSVRS